MRKRWWFLAVTGASLGILAVSGVLWWNSTADLEAVAERARGMGIAPRYEDIRDPEIPDADEIQALTAIEELAKPLLIDPRVGGDNVPIREFILRPDQPDSIRSMAMAHQGIALARLRAAIDALPDQPIRVGPLGSSRFDDSVRVGIRALQPLVCWGDDPVQDLRRITRLCQAYPHRTLVMHQIVMYFRAMVLASAGRIHQQIPADSDMIQIWEQWAREPILDPRLYEEEFRWAWHMYQEPTPEVFINGEPKITSILRLWVVRCGRAEAFHSLLDLIAELSSTHGAAPRLATLDRFESRFIGSKYSPFGWEETLDPAVWNLIVVAQRSSSIASRWEFRLKLHAGLIAALIHRKEIPKDPTDPAGGVLRSYKRDGVLIGYYACGSDGLDGGGGAYDWRYPFDLPWDLPTH